LGVVIAVVSCSSHSEKYTAHVRPARLAEAPDDVYGFVTSSAACFIG